MDEITDITERPTTADAEAVTPADLITHSRSLVPVLRARAERCEAERAVSTETIEDFKHLNMIDVMKPKSLGGHEMEFATMCEIVMTLAEGCASSAWVFSIFSGHTRHLSNWSKEAQQFFWAGKDNVLVSSGKMLNGGLTKVDGGYKVDGVFTFSSGCNHAEWIFAGGNPVIGSDERRMVLMRKDDVQIMDTWNAIGLAGTASHDFEATDVFVSDFLTFPGGKKPPGSGLHKSAAFQGGPRANMGASPLGCVAIGIAAGAIDQFTEEMKSRQSRFGKSIAEFQSLQLRVAESAAEHHAAATLVRSQIKEIKDYLDRGEKVPQDISVRNRMTGAYAARLAASAVDRIFYAGGANALFKTSSLQRSFRDVHAAIAQFGLNWDVAGTNYGKFALGLDDLTPTLPEQLSVDTNL